MRGGDGGPKIRPVPVRVKICCIASPAEAALAIRHGASALGLVSEMPSGPGVIGEDAIAGIAAALPPGVTSVLLTARTDADAIVAQQRRTGVRAIQLVDRVDAGERRRIRPEIPGVALLQVVHVTGKESLAEAREAAEDADALLLDSGRPDAEVRELGGTGRVHDWEVSRRIREASPVPVFLAGGLHAGNVGAAIEAVEPWGVDLCGGVRANGALDEERLGAFMTAVRAAGR